ncbi:ATP-binding cassette domain-containing protein [Devosia sp. J2-20]|uniref:ATP-binding cassette domain-containing protein n=1 Tax=Devosia sp. J2-20 TaxID=3026161 RepID=UPI00249C7AC9|nr:ATP-binding cassette domain-containing protein [Devosia sp. J2-20]WDQ98827.1 ATP-binding cassette domain-containing protein [Devosia sp. J2-20]
MNPSPDQGVVASHLVQTYPVGRTIFGRGEQFRAVDGVSFHLEQGETLGIVGESGSGKSTLGRMIAGIEAPTSGDVTFWGQRYAPVGAAQWRRQRRLVQMVFQNPAAVVDPRWTIHAQVREALTTHETLARAEADHRAQEMLALVGLGTMGNRLPHQLSGGQLQRAVIARALVLQPKLLVCDEAVSALDVSVQAQIINLLLELRDRLQLSLLFISHDLSVVRHISHRVGVMYRGQLLEIGDARTLFEAPQHNYTRRLLAAIPADTPRQRRERDLKTFAALP